MPKRIQLPDDFYKHDVKQLANKDLTDIAESVSRFIDHDKKSHTPRSITPLVKEY
jgi:5-methylthioribose kinase